MTYLGKLLIMCSKFNREVKENSVMTFLEWCKQRYGIIEFCCMDSVGNPNETIFIPFITNAEFLQTDFIQEAGGQFDQVDPEWRGYVITAGNLRDLISRYDDEHNVRIHFLIAGFDYASRKVKKVNHKVSLRFENAVNANYFIRLSNFLPTLHETTLQNIDNKPSYVFKAVVIDRLLYQFQTGMQAPIAALSFNLETQLTDLQDLMSIAKQHTHLFDSANELGKGLYANPNQHQTLIPDVAAIAYSASLAAFSILYADVLSHAEITALDYASRALQTIRTPIFFVKPADMKNVEQLVEQLMDKNSAVNEILIQGGGAKDRYSLIRLIRIGMKATGRASQLNEVVDYYAYYKVEHNFGTGVCSYDGNNKLCQRTMITKIVALDECFAPAASARANIKEYEAAMKWTLQRLVQVEMELLLHDKINPFTKLIDIAWMQLDHQRSRLSGQVLAGDGCSKIAYRVGDPTTPILSMTYSVANDWHVFNLEKDSPFLALETFVSSIIGRSLTAVHLNFMQCNNGATLLQRIQDKIDFIAQKKAARSFFSLTVPPIGVTPAVVEPPKRTSAVLTFFNDEPVASPAPKKKQVDQQRTFGK